ncbi:shufflon system plasmid conjugative transfer pilus tip adhesin PilV [Aeromonas veronii]|uniref:shufflon system plasmid conjugative transfer pilus tip adhesin PilV n=1 Tax=Aeromonas veronii TaxID=654 RepID=UPI003F79EE8A
MTSRCVGRRQCRQSGFTLLEVLIVMVVVSMLLSQAADWYMQYNDQQVAKVVSTQHQQVDKAAAAYIKKNYTTLMAGTLPATKDIDVLRTEGFLPDYSFDCSTTPCKLRNAYSQEYKLVIRKAGTAPNQRLEALVLTFGGQTLGKGDMIRVARNLGASGGYVEAGGAVGSMQGWAIPNLASAFGAGANVGDGHLASAIYFVDGTQSSDYLYRNAVPGKPELNRMGTALDMGGNSITAADQVKAKRGEFSRDGAAPCCGDTGTISLSENTSATGKSASISLHNGGVSEGGIELAKSGQRRIRFFDNQGVTMGIEATGGITSNQGNITANQGNITANNGWIVAYGGGLLSNVWRTHNNGTWTDTGAQFVVNRSISSDGNIAAAGAMTANTMTANAVTSNGRLTTGEFVDVRGVANEGWGCSPNGLIGRDAAGALLSCQSGTWKGGQSKATTQWRSGTCQAPYSSSTTCHLADLSWSCSLAGVSGIGDGEHGYVYSDAGGWHLFTWRGGWPGIYYWHCFK